MKFQLIAWSAAVLAATVSARPADITALSSAPMQFEPASADSSQFLVRGLGYRCAFTPSRALVSAGGKTVRLEFQGSSPAAHLEGLERRASITNVLRGRDASQWRTGIPNYAKLRTRDLYPGIDLVYYGSGGRLEYDFIVRAGADPRRIRMRFAGDQPQLDSHGNLVGALAVRRPVAYQLAAQNTRTPVDARFRRNSDGSFGVTLGAYDPSRELVIDPVLTFSYYGAGLSGDYATAIGHDAKGFIYAAGTTYSSEFPVTQDAWAATKNTGADLFVVKLNPNAAPGARVVYSAFIGGSGEDILTGMAVKPDGSVLLTGTTTSKDFPLGNSAQSSLSGDIDAFVFWLNPAVSGKFGLSYGSYLGGSDKETGGGIAFDSAGRIFVTGATTSKDFPVAGGYQTATAGSSDGFFAVIDPMRSETATLAYSTYIGGGGWDEAHAVAVGPDGTAWIVGATWSGDFPMVGQGYYTGKKAGGDAFLMQIDPRVAGGSSVLYSTYLGGRDQDAALAVAVNGSGHVVVAGYTLSDDFPVTAGAAQPKSAGDADVFVTILDPKQAPQSQLQYSTYYGGTDGELPLSVAIDSEGSIYVAGYTFSDDLPVTEDGMQAVQAGGSDGFVLKLNPSAEAAAGFAYSSYVASSGTQIASAIDVTNDGVIWVAGYTSGPLLETIGGVRKTTQPGDRDAYIFGFKLSGQLAPAALQTRRRARPR